MTIDKYTIDIQVGGINNLTALSSAMLNLNAAVKGNVKIAKDFDATQSALSTALGRTDKGVQNHAKNLGQLVANQSVLGNEYRRVKRDINEYRTGLASATVQQAKNLPQLESYAKALKGIKARAFADDLKSMTVEMKRLGKDAQFTGRSMIIGLTTPILAFGKTGLATFEKVDSELIRLNKLIEGMASSMDNAFQKMGTSAGEASQAAIQQAEEMVKTYKKVDQALIDISLRYGDARELIISIAGDFAEFGFIAEDNIVALTELAAQAEKLGSMDIGPSKDLLTSMYAQASLLIQENELAHNRVTDALEIETKAVNVARGQLYMFNAVENATALSLRDLASAFPEVAASATTFGLTMTESAALLAPMKAAGFDIGAAANAIKVSLQRLNDPTIKSTELIGQLSQVTGFDFKQSTHIGLTAIDALTKGYDHLQASTNYGREGALEFFDEVFGVRQGPRMQRAIADLNIFNQAMIRSGTTEQKIIGMASKQLQIGDSALKAIRSFSDIGAVVRMANAEIGDQVKILDEFGKEATIVVSRRDIDAAKKARKVVGDYIDQQAKEGKDILAQVTSQAGRALVVELGGVGEAQNRATSELKTALDSVKVFIEQIRTNFKIFAADFIESFKPTIETIANTVKSLAEKFRELDPTTKKIIAGFAGIVALAGPLVFAFGQARLLLATISNVALKLLPGLANLTVESFAAGDALLRLKKPVILVGDSFETAASRSSLFIAKLANMNGPIGALARKFGVLTGALKTTRTAGDDVVARLAAINSPAQTARLGGAAQLRSLGNFPPNQLPPPVVPPNTLTNAATQAASATTQAANTAATATTTAATTAATTTTAAATAAASSATSAAAGAAASTTTAAAAASTTAGAATAGVISSSTAAVASMNAATTTAATAVTAGATQASTAIAAQQVDSERWIAGSAQRRIAREQANLARTEATFSSLNLGFDAALQEANAIFATNTTQLTTAATTVAEQSVFGLVAALEESAAGFIAALEAEAATVTGMAASIEGAAGLLSAAGVELNTAAASLVAASAAMPAAMAQSFAAMMATPALGAGPMAMGALPAAGASSFANEFGYMRSPSAMNPKISMNRKIIEATIANPQPLAALPAAGQTSVASKHLPVRGPGGRMMPRYTATLAGPAGGYFPATGGVAAGIAADVERAMMPPQLALPAAGQTVKATKWAATPAFQAFPEREFANAFEANRLTPRITQAIPMGPVPEIPSTAIPMGPGPFPMPAVPAATPDYSNMPRKAKKAAKAAAAKKAQEASAAAKAVTTQATTAAAVTAQETAAAAKAAEQAAAAEAQRELRAAKRVAAETLKKETAAIETAAATAIPRSAPTPFNPKSGSYVSQLFKAAEGDIPGAPAGSGAAFAQNAVAMEKAKTSTKSRRFFRNVLRKGPVANVTPMSLRPAIENALPFEDEINQRFLQTKYTGDRLGDKARRSGGLAKKRLGLFAGSAKRKALAAGELISSGASKTGELIGSGAAAAKGLGTEALQKANKAAISSMAALETASTRSMNATAKAVAVGSDKAASGFRLFGRSAKDAANKLGAFNDKQIDKLKARVVPRARQFATDFSDGRIANAGRGGLGVVKKVTGFNAISGGVSGTKNAINQLPAGAGVFKKLTAGVSGFAGGLKGTIGIMKVFKMAFLGLGITAIIIGIVAAVKILIDIFKSGGNTMSKVGENFSKAWGYIKSAVTAVIKPIKDAIFTLVSMAGNGGGVKGGFQKISEFIMNMAKTISDFVKKYIVPAIKFVMTQVVNLIKGIVKIVQGVIALFKGDTDNAWKRIKEGLVSLARVILKIVLKIVTGWISLWAWMVKSIIKLVAKIISYIIKGIGGAIQWVGEKFASFVEGIPFIGEGLADGIRGTVNTISDALDLAGEGVEIVADGIASGVDTVANGAIGAINNVGDAVITQLNKWGGGEQKLLSQTKKKEQGTDRRAPKVEEVAYDQMGQGIENAAESAAKKIADAVKQALESLQQKFVDLVLGQLNDSLNKATNQMIEALEKQKDAALKVYDDQVENLEKIQKAEESLTKEMQYQADRRRVIKERELQVENFQRDRALAIYEGRIDDARVLALQDVKNNEDYQQSLKEIDTQRNRDLAQENLDALRKSIEEAKNQASKFFDDQIENFKKAAEEITKFPPLTIEEYKSQLDKLNEAATTAATTNSSTFSDMIENMVTTMNDKIPNKGVPAFENNLNQLVQVAHDKYGLGEDGIAGMTVAMLENIGATIDGNTFINESFTALVDSLNESADAGFKNIAESILTPALDDFANIITEHDPFKVLAEAVAFANETILREMQAMVTGSASKVGWLLPYLDQYIVKLATLAAIQGVVNDGTTTPGGLPPANQPINLHDSIYGWFDKPIQRPGISYFNNARMYGGSIPMKAYANGGSIQSFAAGGVSSNNKGMVTGGFDSTGVPALLHGGEFIVNAKAVKNIGLATLTLMNNLRFNRGKDITNTGMTGANNINNLIINDKPNANLGKPPTASVPVELISINPKVFDFIQNLNSPKFEDIKFRQPKPINDINFRSPEMKNPQSGIVNNTNSNSTINIYVDNFIGEDQWFNEMIKQYNMNVLPKKEKGAGLENRVISSYSGLARG